MLDKTRQSHRPNITGINTANHWLSRTGCAPHHLPHHAKHHGRPRHPGSHPRRHSCQRPVHPSSLQRRLAILPRRRWRCHSRCRPARWRHAVSTACPPDTRWECNGQTNQGWRVEPVHRYIQSQLSPEGNFCLDRRDDYQFILSLCSEVQHHLTTLNDLINVGGSEYGMAWG